MNPALPSASPAWVLPPLILTPLGGVSGLPILQIRKLEPENIRGHHKAIWPVRGRADLALSGLHDPEPTFHNSQSTLEGRGPGLELCVLRAAPYIFILLTCQSARFKKL